AARVVVENLRVTGFGTGIAVGSYTTLDRVVSTGNATYGINLSGTSNVGLRINDSTFSFNTTGLKLGSTASASQISVSDSHFDDNAKNGWYSDKNASGSSQLDNVTITNTSFDRNGEKAFYTEKL